MRGLGTPRARARALTSAHIPALPRLVAAASLPSRRGLATARACTSSRTHHLSTALLAVRTAQAHVAVGRRPCLLSPRARLAAQSRRGRALRDPALTSPPSPCPALAPDRVELFGHRPAPPDRTLASPSPPEDPAIVAAWRSRRRHGPRGQLEIEREGGRPMCASWAVARLSARQAEPALSAIKPSLSQPAKPQAARSRPSRAVLGRRAGPSSF